MKIHQEEDQIPRKAILWTMAVVLAISAVGIVVAWLLTTCGEVEHEAAAPAPARLLEPPVRPGEATEATEDGDGRAARRAPMQSDVARDLEAARSDLFRQPAMSELLEAPKRRRLQAFGWVDERGRVVHLPIERAMELYVEARRRETTPEPQSPATQRGRGGSTAQPAARQEMP